MRARTSAERDFRSDTPTQQEYRYHDRDAHDMYDPFTFAPTTVAETTNGEHQQHQAEEYAADATGYYSSANPYDTQDPMGYDLASGIESLYPTQYSFIRQPVRPSPLHSSSSLASACVSTS